MAHHFTAFTPVPGTLNVLLPEPFDQTLDPHGDQPPQLVELIADRHLRRALGLVDGSRISFELVRRV